jgi:lysine/ornithine N-monooxygenase
MEALTSEIELFMEAHGLSATKFGLLALNDRHLVKQLRKGRRLWPETADKVRQFMVTYRPEREAA